MEVKGAGQGESQGNVEQDSEPMEESEGAGQGQGRLDDTWGDISFSEREGQGEAPVAGVQMNWNICKYLPEDAACQNLFQVSNL